MLVLDGKAGGEEYAQKGCTLICVAIDNAPAGYLALSDTLRNESAETIAQLNSLGVKTVLLADDNRNAADTIASELKIRECHAECLPGDKLNWIESRQRDGGKVCMIGDGINDGPSLKKAFVGIAIALVDDEVKKLPHLLVLSKRMMPTIKHNLGFSLGLNFIAIILAITGIFDPVTGALVHNAGSVLVIIYSALLLKWRRKNSQI